MAWPSATKKRRRTVFADGRVIRAVKFSSRPPAKRLALTNIVSKGPIGAVLYCTVLYRTVPWRTLRVVRGTVRFGLGG
jgi:hypothetical protein